VAQSIRKNSGWPWLELISSPGAASGLHFLPNIQPLTFDCQPPIPDRYFFGAKSFQYHRILLHIITKARQWAMLSRGWACLNNRSFSLKFLSVKSRVSITYKLIEAKASTPLFRSLTKNRGRGSYRLVQPLEWWYELRKKRRQSACCRARYYCPRRSSFTARNGKKTVSLCLGGRVSRTEPRCSALARDPMV